MRDAIVNHISEATGEPFTLSQKQPVGGGCINDTYRLKGKNRDYFLKLNQADAL